jgi:hypothetical protein
MPAARRWVLAGFGVCGGRITPRVTVGGSCNGGEVDWLETPLPDRLPMLCGSAAVVSQEFGRQLITDRSRPHVCWGASATLLPITSMIRSKGSALTTRSSMIAGVAWISDHAAGSSAKKRRLVVPNLERVQFVSV